MKKQRCIAVRSRFALIGAMLLALLVAYLNVGLPVMHCLHDQTTSAYFVSDDCCTDKGEKACCSTNNDCASIAVARLAPTLVTDNATPSLVPLWLDLPLWQRIVPHLADRLPEQPNRALRTSVLELRSLPLPRGYLARLGVLII